MKALEVLPKLGRRKVLVNGKPCGRNELIADFIYQQTQKVRDRKQVSSHIQVLKNTRKHEPAFMRLLMDSGEGDEDGMQETTNTGPTTATPPSNSAFDFDTSPSLHASYTHHSSFRHQHSQPKHHQNHQHGHHRVKSDTPSDPMADHTMAHEATAARHNSIQSIYRQSATTPDSAVSLSSDSAHRDFTREGPSSHQRGAYTSPPRYRDLPRGPAILPHSVEFSPLWPTFFGLFIQHPKSEMLTDSDIQQDGFDPSDNHVADSHSLVHTHELARASDLDRHAFSTIDIHQLPQEKFPCLYDLYERATCAFLFFKVDMNLNLALDKGTFENTCLFRANERRTLRCSTVIYSFGAKVLESTEVKQASSAEMSGEDEGFMHSFEFVNQFFNAFLSGIRTLETSDEVEVALCNLSMVQVYEDMDPRAGEEGGGAAAPLLVMAFEFEEGRGGVAPYHIVDGSEMLETLVC
ncbi:hypothetical protein BGZ98_004217 [Dissophora globulifera]|nr:hypothetical protein BGZ98_004217 [Dissophora globulifera]